MHRCPAMQSLPPAGMWGSESMWQHREGPFICMISPHLVFSCNPSVCTWKCRSCLFIYLSFFFQACNCSSEGSASHQCEVLTGHCQCKPVFGGPSCHQCALGFRDFPDCVACDCDLRGTVVDTCDEEQGLCSCAQGTGTCSCKVWVLGTPLSSSLSLLIMTFGLLTKH